MNTPILNKTVTYKRGTSSKFWHVEVAGKKLTTAWGRIGADGQSKVEVFKAPTLAITKAQALLSEKLKKGYTEAIARTKGTRSTKARGVSTTWGILGANPSAAKKTYRHKSAAGVALNVELVERAREGYYAISASELSSLRKAAKAPPVASSATRATGSGSRQCSGSA